MVINGFDRFEAISKNDDSSSLTLASVNSGFNFTHLDDSPFRRTGDSNVNPAPSPASFPVPGRMPVPGVPSPGRPPRDSGWIPVPSDPNSGRIGDNNPGSPWRPPDITPKPDTGTDSVLKRQPGNNPTSDAAVDAFNQDRASRSYDSFETAVKYGKELGKVNEVALEMLMRDWLNQRSTAQPLAHMRGTAILAQSLGEFRLEEGSRLDLTSHADKKPRSLKGFDYDFGGEATTWLRMAAGSLVNAQNYVMSHLGLTVDGQPMNNAYMQQLKAEQATVESKLEQIYGPHDMENIYTELKRQVRSNSGDMQQGLVRLKRQLDELKTSDTRFIAKSARDVAIGMYAEADYMVSHDNGEEAKIMYQAGNQYSAMSQRYDGGAPDNVFLVDLSKKLKPQIEKAIDNQWKDPFNNPFEIPKPNTVVA